MDPLHPIIPQPPNIPPVTPAVSSRRVDRDGNRPAGGQQRKDEPPPRQRRVVSAAQEGWDDDERGDDDEHPHVDVLA